MGRLRHPGTSQAADSTARAALYLHRWLGAFDSVGYLPPWNWAWAIPVTAGFGLVWAAADTLARSAWLAPWQVADEPAEITRLARRPTRRPPAREPGEDCRMT